jgi:hypothetical protein
MRRSVFELPSTLRSAYIAALQLLAEDAAGRAQHVQQGAGPDTWTGKVLDVDVADVTRVDVSTASQQLFDLGADLLRVKADGDHVRVMGIDHLRR